VDEQWDILRQIQGIRFVGGRPQVEEERPAFAPRTKMEFRYPAITSPAKMYKLPSSSY
jgi:hypothetical protein